MSLIRKSTCKIEVETKEDRTQVELGTGFFIGNNIILTSSHVIENCKGSINIYKCHNQNKVVLTAKILDSCEVCDYALLQLNEEFDNEFILELCNSEIIEEEKVEIFGYPDDTQGQDLGEPLTGTIAMKADESTESVQDVVLNILGFAHDSKYDAFSGSPVINEYGQVTSIIKYQAVRSLSSVSVKKALGFLERNNIEVKPDQLQTFKNYNDVFNLFPEDIKTDCESEANVVLESKKPTEIINILKGDLFYPKQDKSITEIITELRKDKDLNNSLWKGWIKLLTYVEIIKGDSSNINHIEFKLTEVDIKTLYGDNISTDSKITVPLKLSFYFTKGQNFFQIARGFLRTEKNQKENTCSIFNSNDEHYFLQKFTNSNKKKIIPNISGEITTGFKIEEKISFGVLGLEDLSSQIINSETLDEAIINIEKLFLDAIK